MRAPVPLFVIAALASLGQDAPPRFTATTNNVIVDAAVIGDPRASMGLHSGDFILLDNGQPAAIAGLAQDQLPLDIVLVCQSVLVGRAFPPPGKSEDAIPQHWFGPSQRNLAQRMMNAAANSVAGIRPGDRVAMVVYGTDPRIEL